jgi:hypothetical protein
MNNTINNILANPFALNQLTPASLIEIITNNAIIEKIKGSSSNNIVQFIVVLILMTELKTMLIDTVKASFTSFKNSEIYKNITTSPISTIWN